ncbi:BolA family protein [Hydrocarboniclastica marina]|uniref:BolA family transcriptional regulator n=1 Tax=Hydrocarboniclastica marina TaxID=2259620 RepID=A0A4P7XMN4_9ALTE|nr:BolA/IbaG family iron-sulfur metabolism protein [Hydrocarboniclastica marina]MAL97090.1 BolA family transcriptional regulator [Alteromonadaceae bacterium]QCF27842.1 BolA family transcriptional regulator [Hydrocarboniclastica marina]
MVIQQQIEQKLKMHFRPTYLGLENESSNHSVPPNSETHFKVVLAAPEFEGKGKVARHQLVYGALADELKAGVHALALHLYTPAEWSERAGDAPASPNCMGGSKARA